MGFYGRAQHFISRRRGSTPKRINFPPTKEVFPIVKEGKYNLLLGMPFLLKGGAERGSQLSK